MTKKKKIILISIATGLCLLVILVSLGLYFYLVQQPSMKAASIRPRKAPKVKDIKSDEEDTQEEQQTERGPEKIVFVSRRDGNDEIYSMNPDGSEQTRLTNNPASDVRPRLSPDRKKIVFWRISRIEAEQRSDSSVYVINADGSGQTKFAEGRSPTWSPDGTKIALSQDGIRIVNMDGKNNKQLTNTGADPIWSPNGTKIAYTDYDNDAPSGHVCVVDLNGELVSRFEPLIYAKRPGYSFSPDGQRLAYVAGGGRSELILANPNDGTTETAVTEAYMMPVWSPDGSYICYQKWGQESMNSYLLNMSTREQSTLTGFKYHYLGPGGCVAWSPSCDAFALAYCIEDGPGGYFIYSVTVDGAITMLTDSGEDSQPHWR